MKVKAAVVRAHDVPLSIEGLELDEIRADEILVRLVASGVTRADLEALAGTLPMPLPFVPGRAGAGIVERVGEAVTALETGDAVLLKSAADLGALNLSGRRLDGSTPFSAESGPVHGFFFGQSSFATHLVCAASSAIKMPMGAALEILAALPGEILVGAAAVAQALALQPGDTIVITGADAAGLGATMVAKARGASLIVVADPRAARRDLATALGATAAVHTDDDLATVVKSLAGAGVGFAVETIGHAPAHQACIDSLKPGGICATINPAPGAMIGQQAEDAKRVVLADVDIDVDRLFAELLSLHEAGRLPLEMLIDFFPFEHVNDALDALAAERVVKPVLRFSVGSFGDLDRALAEGAAREAPEAAPTDGSSIVAPKTSDPEEERQPAIPA